MVNMNSCNPPGNCGGKTPGLQERKWAHRGSFDPPPGWGGVVDLNGAHAVNDHLLLDCSLLSFTAFLQGCLPGLLCTLVSPLSSPRVVDGARLPGQAAHGQSEVVGWLGGSPLGGISEERPLLEDTG